MTTCACIYVSDRLYFCTDIFICSQKASAIYEQTPEGSVTREVGLLINSKREILVMELSVMLENVLAK